MPPVVDAADPPKTLCDICHDPGSCCSGFTLNLTYLPRGIPSAEATERMREKTKDRAHGPYPFVAIAPHRAGSDDAGHDGELWTWGCPKVTSDGRCSIYETRPEPCRNYEAGTTGLCTMTGKILSRAERREIGDDSPIAFVDRIVLALRGDGADDVRD